MKISHIEHLGIAVKSIEEALPYYEKARELSPDKQDLWLNGLYSVYYNLNMGPEFEEIEQLIQ